LKMGTEWRNLSLKPEESTICEVPNMLRILVGSEQALDYSQIHAPNAEWGGWELSCVSPFNRGLTVTPCPLYS
jgi:hypothetical protein